MNRQFDSCYIISISLTDLSESGRRTVNNTRQVHIQRCQSRFRRLLFILIDQCPFLCNPSVGEHIVDSPLECYHLFKRGRLALPRSHVALMTTQANSRKLLLKARDRLCSCGRVDVEDGDVHWCQGGIGLGSEEASDSKTDARCTA